MTIGIPLKEKRKTKSGTRHKAVQQQQWILKKARADPKVHVEEKYSNPIHQIGSISKSDIHIERAVHEWKNGKGWLCVMSYHKEKHFNNRSRGFGFWANRQGFHSL